ncbi:MAG: GH116 family glycosyl hydrolase, partial [Verrucomicrobiota bacterium]
EDFYSHCRYPVQCSLKLGAKKDGTLAAGEMKEFTFYLTWHFPNRGAWGNNDVIVGNYYTTQYADAWNVIEKTYPQLPELEEKTVEFVSAFVSSDLDESVKEAALFNVSTLRSQTVFRTPDGKLFGWEGMADTKPMGIGNCTHVWNYETTLPYLFGDLAKGMRDTEFNHAVDERGLMSFRIGLPLESNAKDLRQAATDGQMGSIMRFYREWQLSGDRGFLEKGWPNVKRALEFAWIKNGWDGDQDGLMEGCLHNTMDIEFFGPHPEIQFWYLGALRASEKMALAMGETEFAEKCARLAESGGKLTDEKIFNGEFYFQIIKASCEKDEIPEGLFAGYYEPDADVHNPNFQLGNGCQTDQMAGQTLAHMLKLGHLADPANIKTALESIMKYNHLSTLEDHLTTTRGYALADDAGVIVATWPKGGKLEVPFPYSSEVWSGLEYTAAAGMFYEGMGDDARLVARDARARSNGSRRNPFNEMEFGNHYARALAAWGMLVAESGFHFSAVEQSMEFTGRPGTYFWSNGYAWGTCTVKKGGKAELNVLFGEVALKQFTLKGIGTKETPTAKTIKVGEKVEIRIK